MCQLGLLLPLQGVSHVGLAPFVLSLTGLGSLLSLRGVAQLGPASPVLEVTSSGLPLLLHGCSCLELLLLLSGCSQTGHSSPVLDTSQLGLSSSARNPMQPGLSPSVLGVAWLGLLSPAPGTASSEDALSLRGVSCPGLLLSVLGRSQPDSSLLLRGAAQLSLPLLAPDAAEPESPLPVQSFVRAGSMLSVRMFELGFVLSLCSATNPGLLLFLHGVACLGFVLFALDAATSDLFLFLRSVARPSLCLFASGSCRTGPSMPAPGSSDLGLPLLLQGVSHIGFVLLALSCVDSGSSLFLRGLTQLGPATPALDSSGSGLSLSSQGCARLDLPLFLHADLSGTLLLSYGKTVLSSLVSVLSCVTPGPSPSLRGVSHPDSSIPVLEAMEMGLLLLSRSLACVGFLPSVLSACRLGDKLPVFGEGDLDYSVFARSLAHCGFMPSTLDFIRSGLPMSARSYARLSDRMSVASSAYLGFTVLVISACSLGSSPSLRGTARAGSRPPALSFAEMGSPLSLQQPSRAEVLMDFSAPVRYMSRAGPTRLPPVLHIPRYSRSGSLMLPRNHMRSDPRLRIASADTLGVENFGMTIEGLGLQPSVESARSFARLGLVPSASGWESDLLRVNRGQRLAWTICTRQKSSPQSVQQAPGRSTISVQDTIQLNRDNTYIKYGTTLELNDQNIQYDTIQVYARATDGTSKRGIGIRGGSCLVAPFRALSGSERKILPARGQGDPQVVVGAFMVQLTCFARAAAMMVKTGSSEPFITEYLEVSTSDRRLKKSIVPLYKAIETEGEAQELQQVLPSLVRKVEDDHLAVVYQDLIALLTAAAQMLQEKVTKQEEKISKQLELELNKLNAKMDLLLAGQPQKADLGLGSPALKRLRQLEEWHNRQEQERREQEARRDEERREQDRHEQERYHSDSD
ncbi:hypothetical protein AK812_SmicGene43532 [Symbiodinium microadriaticum]|uniref:Peptidase S74 domain-containing protein n=1 Tax=Symbiodinium microadriaticum TaxID=2951 RepID=A0A1Q9C0S9_SYMMI|nr:hypothetical protein AK812_SmicGene43532 [Symbiodinium microadriaticum]